MNFDTDYAALGLPEHGTAFDWRRQAVDTRTPKQIKDDAHRIDMRRRYHVAKALRDNTRSDFNVHIASRDESDRTLAIGGVAC